MNNTKTILITGGSGFIGTKLTQELLSRGYSVVVVDMIEPRIKHERVTFEKLNLSKDNIPDKYNGTLFGIIHLAGKNIFGRWTEQFKKDVYDSRIQSTKNIVSTISRWTHKPEVLVSASAFGFYGDAGESEVEESFPPGRDFLAKVCVDWENEARKAEEYGIRTVQIRTSHVLGNSGLLAPLFVPFKFGLGAWIGKGHAWLPWVHIDDIVGIYIFAIENANLHGPVNTAASEQVRQKDFMKIFGQAMGRWVLFSIPIFALYLRYGDLAYTFDNSTKISSKKLLSSGYVFKFVSLKEAFNSIVR